MVAATGIGSGLDIEGLVTQLVAAERGPTETRLVAREAQLTSQLSAFGTLQGSLSSLQSSVDALADTATFSQRSASSSNSDALGVSAGAGAAAGSFSVSIDSLAQSQSLASGSFSSLTDVVGEGELTLRFGTADITGADPGPESFNSFSVNADRASATITIDSSNNTLQGVRDAINAADAGVSAAIVNDGEGFRLLLSSTDTGADNSIEIQVSDTGDSNNTDAEGLSRLAFNTDANNLSQTVAAQDASFSINGLALTSASNNADDVIDGVSLTLQATTEAPVTVTVRDNESAVRTAIESFVSAFNNFTNVSSNLTAYDAETDRAGALQGDFATRSIITQVRSALTGSSNGFEGPFSTLAELGITTQANGNLAIDEGRLGAALRDNFDSVAGVFAQVGQPNDSSVVFDGAGSSTQVGNFSVEVTQLATRGSIAGAAIVAPTALAPLTIDGSNDTLRLTIDGVSTDLVSLTQGDFDSGDALAAELQSRINGDDNLLEAGIAVSVTFDASNRLQIQSSRFGSESSVVIDSVAANTTGTLGLSAGSGTNGVDVAGTIGGVAATGSGQSLVGATGSASEGIRLSIIGGTTGSRGSVNISSGVAVSLSDVIDRFLDSNGLIDLRTDTLEADVARIEEDREALEARLEAIEARFRNQFNALDILLANLQSTSEFLTTQLAGIPLPGQNNN
ncbi:flagellar filament capping protein FliD [Congregibacter brevis]|uniref:Flagellar hook-associated protein 2 n=1 Tax=Congregibacter brevis TaxID=3081201 RepID=A0ABZ0IC17_9GAMM|nr:flagellar filament capping protein FliD [Congregibacter sp. IMCC45268]